MVVVAAVATIRTATAINTMRCLTDLSSNVVVSSNGAVVVMRLTLTPALQSSKTSRQAFPPSGLQPKRLTYSNYLVFQMMSQDTEDGPKWEAVIELVPIAALV